MKSQLGSIFNIFVPLALVASLIGGALTATPARAAAPCYVDGSASGVDDGSSWADAYSDLQSALTNPSCVEIWVAQGMYATGGIFDTFNVKSGVKVYGGFAGGESLLTDRDPVANVTILTGDFGADDTNTDGNRIDETTGDIIGANTAIVVIMDGTSTPITSSTVLDGLTVTGGDGTYGGGLECLGDNIVGGCSPTLTSLTFSGNRASQFGGAIFIEATSLGTGSPTLTDVTFQGNASANSGGAMANYSSSGGTSSPSLTNVTFSGNSALDGGAIWDFGGAGGNTSPTLTNVTFSGNYASGSGGAMYGGASGGASFPTLINVTFRDNSAGAGGAIMNADADSNPTLTNVILWGDMAGISNEIYNGGGAAPTISYSIVQGSGGSGIPWDIALGTDGGNNLDANPMLDPSAPANNGGFTKTMALLPGSPAIEAGTNTGCTANDQRGLVRPVGTFCDIGAFEAPALAGGPTCYVDASGSGAPGGGASWSDPYIHLQAALANPDCAEIWVANGLYTPGAKATDTFNVPQAVAVYGGFAGGELLLANRLPASSVAILSGDVGGNDTNTDGNQIAESIADIQGTNAFHVVKMDGTSVAITASTVLDGFSLTAGQATGSGYGGFGGGLLCLGASGGRCNPSLGQLVIIGNSAGNGGGMFLDGSSGGSANPTLTDVTFSANVALTGWGGGMYNQGGGGSSNPTLVKVTFVGNQAGRGGGMMNDGRFAGESSPTLANVTFFGNSASDGGGAMANDGSSAGSNSSPTLLNVTFHGNQATGSSSGGAMYNDGSIGGNSSPALTNVILWGDTAAGSAPEIFNNTATEGISHSVVQGSGGSGAWVGPGVDLGGNIDADPVLDSALANNGGYTESLALLAGSSAIDNGDDSVCAAAPVNGLDQRGVYRPQGPHCDIGAYEKELPAAEMIRVLPDPDSTVCPAPVVQVQVYILDSILSDMGSPDPVKTQLKLDGVDVSGLAMNMETLGSPVAQVIVRYTPGGDLALGLHDAMFTYPSPGGPRTRVWSFTVASIPCDVVAGGPIDASGPVDSSRTGADGDVGVAPAPAGGRQP